MIKKILALSLCLMLSASLLTSCDSKSSSDANSETDSAGDNNSVISENSPDLVINGEHINTDGLVMCTIDGFDISYDEFRYYWMFYYEQLTALGYDFENNTDEVLSLLKYNTINDLSATYAMMGLARANSLDYTVPTDDLQTAYMYRLMQFETESEYADYLAANYLTDSAMQSTLTSYLAYDIAYNALFGEDGKYFVDNDGVADIFASDEMARCVHILIPFSACADVSDENKEIWDDLSIASRYSALEAAYLELSESEQKEVAQKSFELAEEVLAKAQAGEDFYSLIEQYNYDPGMEPEEGQSYSDITGYYFTKDYNYVQEFIDATFALNENEISPVITSESYGYHIILRLPVDADYVAENIDDLAREYNEINAIKVFNEYFDSVDITYSEYFDKLTIDSIS